MATRKSELVITCNAKAVKDVTGGFVDLTRLPRAREAMEYGFGYRLVGEKSPVFADGGG